MRAISPSLLAAQQAASHTPYVKVEASNLIGGIVRLEWERLYSGPEEDYFHAFVIAGDGSLVRVRLTPPADGRRLFLQRVVSPGPSSDFSSWTYTGHYDCVVVAAAACGAEVSIFWMNTARELRRIKSTDYGANWGRDDLIDYTPTTAVNGLAAAYKPNGDLALFFADQATLYSKKCVGGNWQPASAWDKTSGDLSGVAVTYGIDWELLVAGKDSGGDLKLWSFVFGDGGEAPVASWSSMKEIASAPASGDFEYRCPFIDKPDAFRCFFVENYTGTEAYSRPYWSHSVVGRLFGDGLWREPVPFNASSAYGLALAHHGGYCWLSSPAGVWRAPLAVHALDLTGDVLALDAQQSESGGRLRVELRNDTGIYSALPPPLGIGCRLSFSPGYVTAAGNEVSPGPAFMLEQYQHRSSGGRATMLIEASDGWQQLQAWTARCQYRWNKSGNEASVKDVLAFVLARTGLGLEVVSASSTFAGFYPDFTINPGDKGDAIVVRLLSFVRDLLFFEGDAACVVNPSAEDATVYGYGGCHVVFEGSYGRRAGADLVRAEGFDPSASARLLVDSFDWASIGATYGRLRLESDRNLDTISRLRERGQAILRRVAVDSEFGQIEVPANCGQQLYDVIDITDGRAGLTLARKRVLGMRLQYDPAKGQYEHRLTLGGV